MVDLLDGTGRPAALKKVPPIDAGVKSTKSRKDLDKTEKCNGCGKPFPRWQLRGGADQDTWYCIPNGCWEEKHGYPPPEDRAAKRHEDIKNGGNQVHN